MRRSNFELNEQRNDDLLRAVKEVVIKYSVNNTKEAVAMAIKMPSKRFWVTSQVAARVIWRMEKGDMLKEMRPTARKRFFELYKLYQRLRDTDEFKNRSIYYMSAILVEQPAPEFYLTVDSALKIYTKHRKKRKWEKIAKLECIQY